jgi:short chain dehydrogenase
MQRAVEIVEAEEGAVGVLVNNAGYGLEGPVEEASLDELRRQFETNLFGPTRLTQLVLPGMRRQGRGKVVNVSSVGGRITIPGGGACHASKHALEALSDALRFEVRGFGIDVILIEPGAIRSSRVDTAVASMRRPRDRHSPYGHSSTPSRTAFTISRRLLPDRAWDASMRRLLPSPGAPGSGQPPAARLMTFDPWQVTARHRDRGLGERYRARPGGVRRAPPLQHFVVRAHPDCRSQPLKCGNSRPNCAMHSGRGFVEQPGQEIGSTARRLPRVSCQQCSHDRHNQWTISQSATRASGAAPHRGQSRGDCPPVIAVVSGKSSIPHAPARLQSSHAEQSRRTRGRSHISAADSRQGVSAVW